LNETCTVVVTCFDEGNLLRRALESLRAQTDRDFEILIVNDASTDPETNAVCSEAESEGLARVVWRERNGGLSAARNSGYETMHGAICVPLDADDTLPAGAVAAIRASFRSRADADFVFGNYVRHDVDRGTRVEVDCSRLARDGVLAAETLASGEWILYGGSPCRKELWSKLGGYRAEFSYDTQDLDFWMRALTAGFVGCYAGTVIYEWSRASSGMNARVTGERWVRTRARNIAFYDRFGDGTGARRQLMRNALSVRAYDCARDLARQLVQRGDGSALARFVAGAPPAVLRGVHRLWLSLRPARPDPGGIPQCST
jgi:glycosyltransferase involved in cell wall biosynthesis